MNTAFENRATAFVPISRFNKGEALKIFEEVSLSGYKVVIKDDTPACVLITPARYQEMLELIEDGALFVEAEKRNKNGQFISEKTILFSLGISEEELIDVED